MLYVDVYYKDVEVSEGFDVDGLVLCIQDVYFDNDVMLNGGLVCLVYDFGDKFVGFIGVFMFYDDFILFYYVMVDFFVCGMFDVVKVQFEVIFDILFD